MTNQVPTILCGIDGSEPSVRAAQVADALSAAMEAQLVLAHVSSGGLQYVPVPYPVAVEDALENAPDVIAETAGRAGLTAFRSRQVEASSPTAGLIAAARVEHPALIVVGASGHSRVREALLGSVAGELPLEARCPVVVTPRHAAIPGGQEPLAGPRAVVCGVRGSEEAETATRTAGALAPALGARLILVHARLPLPPPGGAVVSRHSVALADDVVARREQQLSAELIERAAGWSGCDAAAVEPAMEIGDPRGADRSGRRSRSRRADRGRLTRPGSAPRRRSRVDLAHPCGERAPTRRHRRTWRADLSLVGASPHCTGVGWPLSYAHAGG